MDFYRWDQANDWRMIIERLDAMKIYRRHLKKVQNPRHEQLVGLLVGLGVFRVKSDFYLLFCVQTLSFMRDKKTMLHITIGNACCILQ